jgi:NADH:ubiquinone oxidoreductase subunit 3 (subunit A)
MSDWMLTPPIVFMLLFTIAGLILFLSRFIAAKGQATPGKDDPYACGQDVPTGRYQPGYADFFQFAFLFTILDVATLMLGTVAKSGIWLTIPILAIVGLALVILFRKD